MVFYSRFIVYKCKRGMNPLDKITSDMNTDVENSAEITTDAENIDYSALSHDELVAIIKDLKAQLDTLLNPPPNDWHAWFYALLRITFHKYPTVDVLREVMLGVQAPRADFIIIVDDQKLNLGLKIFSFFKKHDILEFKSPDDELNMFTLWKGVGYVSFYLNDVKEKGKDIDMSEITLSFFRESKPVKLFEQLGKCIEKGPADGIYYIKNWEVNIPIQIVVTKELKGEEYAGFRAISKKPKEEDVLAFMKEHGNDKEIASFVKAFGDGVSKVDSDLMEEIKGRYPEMGKTLMQIMQPEIDEKINDATRTNLFLYVQDGAMNLDYAAKQANLTVDQFQTQMNEYVKSHKATTV